MKRTTARKKTQVVASAVTLDEKEVEINKNLNMKMARRYEVEILKGEDRTTRTSQRAEDLDQSVFVGCAHLDDMARWCIPRVIVVAGLELSTSFAFEYVFKMLDESYKVVRDRQNLNAWRESSVMAGNERSKTMQAYWECQYKEDRDAVYRDLKYSLAEPTHLKTFGALNKFWAGRTNFGHFVSSSLPFNFLGTASFLANKEVDHLFGILEAR